MYGSGLIDTRKDSPEYKKARMAAPGIFTVYSCCARARALVLKLARCWQRTSNQWVSRPILSLFDRISIQGAEGVGTKTSHQTVSRSRA